MNDYPVYLLNLFAIVKIEIDTATGQLERGEITVDQWRDEMEQIILRAALAAMMLGLDTEVLTAQAAQTVNEYVQGQQPYLDGFASDIESGISGGWNGGWNIRAEMYGERTQELYWRGVTRFLRLPAYPGDCTSECMTSDRCMWILDWIDEANLDVDAYWIDMKDKGVCKTCVRRGIQWSPLRIRNGVVPKANVTD
jgi:hypothetical protein